MIFALYKHMNSLWLETSLNELYASADKAFPNTSKRQHSTDTIKIEHLTWIPFQGVKTLFIKGLAVNEGRKNEPIIVFKKVKYQLKEGKNIVSIMGSNGKRFFLEKLSSENNDVLVRCSCKDFMYRFNYYNHIDKSLFGRKRAKYEGKGLWEANSSQMPGMCKHLIKMVKILHGSKLLNQ